MAIHHQLPVRCSFWYVLCVGTLAWAGSIQPRFTHYSLEEGLSQSTVYTILQDHNGFIWCGTSDGLNRFDGNHFKQYHLETPETGALTTRWIRTMWQDQDGTIWLGTNNGGVLHYNPATDHFTHQRKLVRKNDVYWSVDSFLLDDKQRLWIGGGAGIDLLENRFDPQHTKLTQIRHDPTHPMGLPEGSVNQLYSDRQKRIWVSSDGGGFSYTVDGKQFTALPLPTRDSASRTGMAVFQDKAANFWLGTGNGLHRMGETAPGSGCFEPVPFKDLPRGLRPGNNNHVRTFFEGEDGRIWIGTIDGLYIYHPIDQRFTVLRKSGSPSSLSSNSVWVIVPDRMGCLWFGTEGGGLNRIDLLAPPFEHIFPQPEVPYGLSDAVVTSFLEDHTGRLWVGTLNGGLNREIEPGKFRTYRGKENNGLSSDVVWSLYQDPSHTIWLGTYGGGLARYVPEGDRFLTYQPKPDDSNSLSGDRILHLTGDGDDGLWIATDDRGLNHFNPKTGKFSRWRHEPDDSHSIRDDSLLSLWVDHMGTLWVGTRRGLSRKLYDQDLFTHFLADFEDPNSLPGDNINVIYQYPEKGPLWIGTNRGLARFDQNGVFTIYNKAQGLPNDSVLAILGDDFGYIWASTNLGLARIDPRTGRIKNYDKRHGLQSDEFNFQAALKRTDGRLLFGGINGYNAFHAQDILDNPYPPIPIVAELHVNNKVIKPGQTYQERVILEKAIHTTRFLRLTHRDYMVSLDLGALHFAAPEKNQLSYRLKGLDPGWVTAEPANRRATYTSLAPGRYTFQLRAANKDGVWNEQRFDLDLEVLPAPWLSWWAKAIYILLVAGLLAVYLRSQWRIKEQLERKVAARTAALNNKQRQLLEAAHAAGKAENAVMLLHDVGNQLNSVFTSIGILCENDALKRDTNLLNRTLLLLDAQENPAAFIAQDPRGDHILKLVHRLHQKLEQHLKSTDEEYARLDQLLRSIRTSMEKQREQKHVEGWSMAPENINDIIEETIARERFLFHEGNVHIEVQLSKVPPLLLERAKITHILTYLLHNALEAIEEVEVHGQGRIVVATTEEADQVLVTITDNGVGLRHNEQTNLFAQGYTTKADRQGFGLHYCAIATREMGGGIQLIEAPKHRGAQVRLMFPAASSQGAKVGT